MKILKLISETLQLFCNLQRRIAFPLPPLRSNRTIITFHLLSQIISHRYSPSVSNFLLKKKMFSKLLTRTTSTSNTCCLLLRSSSNAVIKNSQSLISSATTQTRHFTSNNKENSTLAQTVETDNSTNQTAGCPYHQNVANTIKEIKPWNQVPGPKPWPLIGNLIDIKKNAFNPSGYFLSLCDTYGDLVKLTVFGTNMLIIANPYVLSELFKKEDRRKLLESTRYYKEPRGLVLSPVELRLDEDWNSIRQLFNIAMRPEFQENITIPQLTELNGEFLRRLVANMKHIPQSDKYQLLNTVDTTSRYAFDAVLKVFLVSFSS